MNWLRKKIINWLFEGDYASCLDTLKEYIKVKEEICELSNKFRQESIKTKESQIEVRKSYIKIAELCKQINNDNKKIIEVNKELFAKNERLINIIKELEEKYNA